MRGKAPLVAAFVYDGLCAFEFGIVVEAFALPRPELKVPWYRFSVCSIDGERVTTALGGVNVQSQNELAAMNSANLIVIPGWRDVNEDPPRQLLAALQRAHPDPVPVSCQSVQACSSGGRWAARWETRDYHCEMPIGSPLGIRALRRTGRPVCRRRPRAHVGGERRGHRSLPAHHRTDYGADIANRGETAEWCRRIREGGQR